MAPTPQELVDGQEIDVKIVPHHQEGEGLTGKTGDGGGPNLLKLAFTGTAVVGGIVGLWWLYNRIFRRRSPSGNAGGGNGTPGKKLARRDYSSVKIEEELQHEFDAALNDEGFLGFLEELGEAGLLEQIAEP